MAGRQIRTATRTGRARPSPTPAARSEVPAPVEVPEPAAVDSPDGPPPLSGRGSSRDAWAVYAAGLGVEVSDDMTRDDIVELVKEATGGNDDTYA